ncbi:MAG TPA: alpha-amylase family glycosyl hydrolase [Thermoanaerobaculia bacterium]|jgi:glycosidase|nr:alpha-amylase family glycosyl hydrolase [Thermoanaerobaculia bacterium]
MRARTVGLVVLAVGLGASAAGVPQGTQTTGTATALATQKPAATGTAQSSELPNLIPADAWQLGWARGSVFYVVSVRSFADSNGDGVGDLPGLISKLDYLNDGDPKSLGDLGVDALCLMPIFSSRVAEYEKIQPAYGTEQDFARLIAAAHQRGMKVILDLPMADLSFRNPTVRTEIKRVAKLWLDRGVDGFRLDLIEKVGADAQADTPETHAFLKEFSAAIRKANPAALLVGETGTDAKKIAPFYGSNATVGGGDELPMSLNVPLASAIVASLKAGEPGPIHAALDEMEAKAYPKWVLDATFLTHQDMNRVATELTNDPARLKLAAALLLTLPGTAFVYYGEELGLQNGSGSKDESNRTPMPWDATPTGGFTTAKPWHDLAPGRESANVAAETADPNSLLSIYRLLIRARHHSNSLRFGTIEKVDPPGQPAAILSYLRRYEGAHAIVVHNLSGAEVEAGPFYVGGGFDPIYVSPGVPPPTGGKTGRKVKLPPYSSGVWRF